MFVALNGYKQRTHIHAQRWMCVYDLTGSVYTFHLNMNRAETKTKNPNFNRMEQRQHSMRLQHSLTQWMFVNGRINKFTACLLASNSIRVFCSQSFAVALFFSFPPNIVSGMEEKKRAPLTHYVLIVPLLKRTRNYMYIVGVYMMNSC